MIRHDDTDMTVNLITADAKAKAEMWKLESTPRRRAIADHVMELLVNECSDYGGAADATTGLCLALAEAITDSHLPGSWDGIAELTAERVREEVARIAALTFEDRKAALDRLHEIKP